MPIAHTTVLYRDHSLSSAKVERLHDYGRTFFLYTAVKQNHCKMSRPAHKLHKQNGLAWLIRDDLLLLSIPLNYIII